MKEELKTLKDLREVKEGDIHWVDVTIFSEELREEAKKWIVKIETKIKEKEGQFDDFGIDLGMEYGEKGNAIIGFIKHFFNLEDEK